MRTSSLLRAVATSLLSLALTQCDASEEPGPTFDLVATKATKVAEIGGLAAGANNAFVVVTLSSTTSTSP